MPATTSKPAQGVASPSKKRKLKGRKAPTFSTTTIHPTVHDARSGSESKLPKPLGPESRRVLSQKTSKLIRKRNELDRALLLQAFRPLGELSANDWLPREELLRECERMVSRERDYMRTRTKELEERTVYYNQDPSEERALDLNLIRTQLWKFKRHLGPYLEAAEEPRDGGEDHVSSSESEFDSSDEQAEVVHRKTDGSGPSRPTEGDAATGRTDKENPSVGLDGAFDDIRGPRKRKSNDLSDRKEPRKKARKEQASSSAPSTTSQSQSVEADAPARSKEMEASLAQIYNSMSQTDSSQVSINGTRKSEVKEAPVKTAPVKTAPVKEAPVKTAPVKTTTRDASEKADQKAPKTPASSSSSSNNSISDGAARPFYQRHAKAVMRPDFDDLVYDRPQHRRGPKSKQKRRQYLVSGALPVPHLPSPKPDKAKSRSASTDGP